MRIKYNRVSTLQQSGNRFSADENNYDLVLFDKVSGKVPFKERPKAQELGRTIGDCIQTLEWLETHEINVVVRNLGIQSRPNGNKNPIWGLLSATMASLYSLELENIRERTATGRQVYVQNGGRLGRPCGSTESDKRFMEKPKTQQIIKLLEKGRTVREIAAIVGCSSKTVQKSKQIAVR